MQTTIFYIFEPTPKLEGLAKSAGQGDMAEPAVWLVRVHDRVGSEHSLEELSRAHWSLFVANLMGEADEAKPLTDFREQCLALGFSGCWTIAQTKVGGDAAELVAEGRSAEEFLSRRGGIPRL